MSDDKDYIEAWFLVALTIAGILIAVFHGTYYFQYVYQRAYNAAINVYSLIDHQATVRVNKVRAKAICNKWLDANSEYNFKSHIDKATAKKDTYTFSNGRTFSAFSVKIPVEYQNKYGAYKREIGHCFVETRGNIKNVVNDSLSLVINPEKLSQSTVPIKAPNGKVYMVPISDEKAALKAGGVIDEKNNKNDICISRKAIEAELKRRGID